MVHKCWIVNASPLILLGKAGYLHLLSNLAEVIKTPVTVHTTTRRQIAFRVKAGRFVHE